MSSNGGPPLSPRAPHRTAAASSLLLPGWGFVLVGARLRRRPLLRQLRRHRQDPAVLHQRPGDPAYLHCEGTALQPLLMAGHPQLLLHHRRAVAHRSREGHVLQPGGHCH